MDAKKRERFLTHRSTFIEFKNDLTVLLESSPGFAFKYQLECVFSKLLDDEFALTKEERRSAAIKKWLQTEERNEATNRRLYLDDDVLLGPTSWHKVKRFARRLIRDTIGDAPDYDILRKEASFSGGASTGIRRSVGAIARKYSAGTDITENAIKHFQLINDSISWNPSLNIVEGNVMFTVPKSTTIDRVACKEPDLNMYVQKAVGNFFRTALRRKGVNLNDQTINQELAYLGSITGELATIDLSSASDSVTTQLVIALLPFEWYSLLLDLRSPTTVIDGLVHSNEMISSMGNGFTFELESLIFWALARSAAYYSHTRGRVSVYGDDIILPCGAYPLLNEILTHCGFLVNTEKSFWTGNFRESCGKHYLEGSDVTPFFIRKVPQDVSDWIHVLNSLRAWLDRLAPHEFLDSSYWTLWKKYSELVPVPLHGGHDYARRDILVSHGRRPLARLARKQRRADKVIETHQLGLYLQWLDTSEDASGEPTVGIRKGTDGRFTVVDPPEVSALFFEGGYDLRRIPKSHDWIRTSKVFLEELEKA